MGYYEKIDKKKTIARAKKALKEYARLLDLLGQSVFDLGVKSYKFDLIGFTNYINSDEQLIKAIDRKDKNYAHMISYISDIQKALNTLPLNKIEVLKLTYINNMRAIDTATKMDLSQRSVQRLHAEALVDFAISYGMVLYK